MRNRYIVAYDVSDPKRLRRAHVKLLGFGDPLQYSVFQCDLNPAERALMIGAVRGIINQREDRVLIADLGPCGGRGSASVEWLGRAPGVTERRFVVV